MPIYVGYHLYLCQDMKIAILSHSDTLGGAAIAASRLADSLRAQGQEVTLIVMDRHGDGQSTVRAGCGLSRSWAFLSERLDIFLHNRLSKRQLFKVSTAEAGQNLASMREIREADLVLVGWACQGLLSLKQMQRICAMPGKKVAVVMHDLWWMTGICHYPFGCQRYEKDCGCCKFLGSRHDNDLSRRVWHRKHRLYSRLDNVAWIAVSRWVKECAARSSLLGRAQVKVVHNIFPIDDFAIAPIKPVAQLEAWAGRKIITMGAASLDNEVKGLDRGIDALNNLPDDWRDKVVVALYGSMKNPSLLSRLTVPWEWLGPVGHDRLRDILASSHVIMSSARHETYGWTLLEGIASGAVAATYGGDGRNDIVNDGVNGFIAGNDSPEALTEALVKALEKSSSHLSLRLSQRESVAGLASEPFLPAALGC